MLAREKRKNLSATLLRAHQQPARRIDPMTWKTFFARSRPIVLTSPMDGFSRYSTTSSWHVDAVAVAVHPSFRRAGALCMLPGDPGESRE
jgi:hypothetical protein